MKKTNIKLVKIALILIGLLGLHSCYEEKSDKDFTKTEDNFSVVEANTNNVKLKQKNNNIVLVYENSYNHTEKTNTSRLKITKENKLIYDITYNIDFKETKYKFRQSDKVIEFARKLNKEINDPSIDNGIDQLLSNGEKVFGQETVNTHLKPLFFHKSILETKKRQLANKGDCECTVHPSYLIDKTGFLCQEDFYIPIEIFKNSPEQRSRNVVYNDTEEVLFKQFINPYIKNKRKFIRFDNFYSFFVSKPRFNAFVQVMKNDDLLKTKGSDCWFGKGSDHGCCGNYDGCCYYTHIACYVHDKMCTDCKPRWFCLSGCIPDKKLKEDSKRLEQELIKLKQEKYGH